MAQPDFSNYEPVGQPTSAPAQPQTARGPTPDFSNYTPVAQSGATTAASAYQTPEPPPTPEVSNVKAFAKGALHSGIDTYRGTRQVAMHLGNYLGLISNQDLAEEQSKLDTSEAEDAQDPDLQSTAGKIGEGVGTAAQLFLPGLGEEKLAAMGLIKGGRLAGVLGQTGVAGAYGALQPVTTDQGDYGRVINTAGSAAGGAIGGLVGKGLGYITQPFKNELSEAGQKSADLLKAYKVDLDSAQATDSGVANAAKITADTLGPKAAAQKAEEQAGQATRAALITAGDTSGATAASPPVMQRIREALVTKLQAYAAANPVPLTGKLATDFDDLDDAMLRKYPGTEAILPALGNPGEPAIPSPYANARGVFKNLRTAFIKGNYSLGGDALLAQRYQLSALHSGTDVDREFGGKAAKILDEAIEAQGAANGNPGEWANINNKLGNLNIIKKALLNDMTEHVNPTTLANIADSPSNANASVFGMDQNGVPKNRELIELAQALKNRLVGGRYPNSGTATRALLTQAGAGVGSGAVYGLATGDWDKTNDFLAAGAGALGTRYIANELARGGTGRVLTHLAHSRLLNNYWNPALKATVQGTGAYVGSHTGLGVQDSSVPIPGGAYK